MKDFQQRCLELLKDEEVVGLSVLTTNKEEITNSFTYKYADLENQIPTSLDNIYRIASVSKIEVALAIMKLVEQGKLDIKEDVSKYLGFKFRNPYFPNDIITLEMIMTQTSSLNDGVEDGALGYEGVNGRHTFVDLNTLINDENYEYYTKDTFLNKKPGTFWNYSNFGCGILACIVEKVSGVIFTEYVKKEVFDKLGLDASFRISDIKNKDKVANLYVYQNGEFKISRTLELLQKGEYPIHPLGQNFRGPAGGLLISPNDLSKIMRMMMNKGTFNNVKVFEPSTIELMEEIHWEGIAEDDPIYRKKGLQLLLLDGYTKHTLKGHYGYAYGLRSFMLYNDHVGFIFVCNGANFIQDTDMTRLQKKFLQLMSELDQ